MSFDQYEQYDATGLARLISEGELTASQVVAAAIQRIEARDLRLNAVVTRLFEEALAEAAHPRSGPFAGVPMLVKDLGFEMRGVLQTDGSRSLRGFRPDFSATSVSRFREAGFIIVGRTNAPEFGLAPVTEPEANGVTANPWNPKLTAGGSSGGSAVAVAAGYVPVASASDGGGSIRIPACHCGVFGFKPSRGRVPTGPILGEGWFGMSTGGAITRSVRDSAAVLDVLSGPEPGDAYAAPPPERPFRDEVGMAPGRLRVGVIGGAIFGSHTHPDCRGAVSATADLMADLGHQVEGVELPIPADAYQRAFLVLVAAAASNVVDLTAAAAGLESPDADSYESTTWALSQIGRVLSAADFGMAFDTIRSAGRVMGRVMEHFDVLVSSTTGLPPFPHGALQPSLIERKLLASLKRIPARRGLLMAFDRLSRKTMEPIPNTPLFNMTGQPAMSVPLHWTNQGLPVGVQFAARYGDDATLFRLAAQLEEARPWFDRRPPLQRPI